MARPAVDYTGVRFGKLVAKQPATLVVRHGWMWTFLCDCGKAVVRYPVSAKRTGHCGCETATHAKGIHTVHGMTNSGTYSSWLSMRMRCYSKVNASYKYYGGVGITVCDKWKNSFTAFLGDMGVRPDGCSLDRIDNAGNYCPENCRWSTREEQIANRRNSVLVVYKGEVITVGRLAKRYGLGSATLRGRLIRGWSLEDAVNRRVDKSKRNKKVG